MFEIISESTGKTAEVFVVFGEVPLELFEGKKVIRPVGLDFSQAGGLASIEKLKQCFDEAKYKRLVVVGAGSEACLAQALAVAARKTTRKLVLFDALTRPSPSVFERFIDWLENSLPLGLPMGKSGKFFDARSLLYRISCPVLVVVADGASAYVKAQGKLLAERIANAYFYQDSKLTSEELASFLNVPSKLPAKNLQ